MSEEWIKDAAREFLTRRFKIAQWHGIEMIDCLADFYEEYAGDAAHAPRSQPAIELLEQVQAKAIRDDGTCRLCLGDTHTTECVIGKVEDFLMKNDVAAPRSEPAPPRNLRDDLAIAYRLGHCNLIDVINKAYEAGATSKPTQRGPCSACGDGDWRQEFHTHDSKVRKR